MYLFYLWYHFGSRSLCFENVGRHKISEDVESPHMFYLHPKTMFCLLAQDLSDTGILLLGGQSVTTIKTYEKIKYFNKTSLFPESILVAYV